MERQWLQVLWSSRQEV